MRSGVIRLFRFAGIDVFLHYTWFLIAAFYIPSYTKQYSSPVWGVFEYLAVFVIVLIHEFGHALACRQVGGIADRIVLWPLGGIAFVNPPRRAGAYLWSIAAGPLVNVALIPILAVIGKVVVQSENSFTVTDAFLFFRDLQRLNLGLLIFNILPIFPLDGGQILRGLLWYPFGEIRSLQISSVVGLIGGAGLALVAVLVMGLNLWILVIALFLVSRAWVGWQTAKAMIAAEKAGIPVSPSPTATENPPPPYRNTEF